MLDFTQNHWQGAKFGPSITAVEFDQQNSPGDSTNQHGQHCSWTVYSAPLQNTEMMIGLLMYDHLYIDWVHLLLRDFWIIYPLKVLFLNPFASCGCEVFRIIHESASVEVALRLQREFPDGTAPLYRPGAPV